MTEQRKTRTVYQQPPSSSGGSAPQLASALFSRPQYDLPDLPTNLTDLNDDVLMTLFSQYTGWMNFAATQLAEAEVTEAKAEAQVKFLEAQGMVKNWDPKAKVTTIRAELATDPKIEAAKGDVLTAYAARKMTQVVYDNCERSVFVVSRELSRRIGASGVERRNLRWNP